MGGLGCGSGGPGFGSGGPGFGSGLVLVVLEVVLVSYGWGGGLYMSKDVPY